MFKQKKSLTIKDLSDEGETRTRIGLRPLPPQSSVSTSFTTSPVLCLGVQRWRFVGIFAKDFEGKC
jgi:hypothetical protein